MKNSITKRLLVALALLLGVEGALLAQCASPSGGRTEDLYYRNRATLRWDSPDSDTYTLRWRAVGGSWQTVTGLGINNYILSALAQGSAYEWQIKRLCSGGGESAYGPLQAFTTAACPLPRGLAVGAASPLRVDLRWSNVWAGYELQWKPISSATWSVRTGGADIDRILNDLQPGTAYQWRLRSTCPSENNTVLETSPWADGPNFTTPVCPAPTYVPFSNLARQPDNLNRVLNYVVEISAPDAISGEETAFEFEWRRVDNPTAWENTFTGAWNSTVFQPLAPVFSIPNLVGGTAYQYRIRTVCNATAKSDYVMGDFATLPCYALKNPSVVSNDNGGVYIYQESDFLAAGIAVLVGKNQLTSQFFYRWRAVGGSAWTEGGNRPITNINYEIKNLLPDTQYEWQVRAECSASERMPPSPVRTFRTTPAVPCARPDLFPAADIASSAALLSWTRVSAATGYTLHWRPTGAANWTTVSNLTEPNYQLTGLSANTAYEYKVQAGCPGGGVTDFTRTDQLITVCQPPVLLTLAPNLLAGPTAIKLSWGLTEAGAQYDVRRRLASGSTFTEAGPLTPPPNAPLMSYTLAGLNPATNYVVQVRSRCANGSLSAYSADLPVTTTTCAAPTSVFAFGVTNGTAQISAGLVDGINWELQWRPQGGTTWNNVSGISTATYTLNGLISSVIYEFQARVICPGGPTAYTSVVNLTTL